MPDIQYLGHSCFRLRGRDRVVIADPYDRSVGYDIGKPTASIVTISHQHDDHNCVAAVRPQREDEIFLIEGPGEYEVGGVMIEGVRTYHDTKKGEELGNNTAYVIRLDDVVFCHLGDLGHELSAGQIDAIGNVDVLFIPVGGGETIDANKAAAVISQIEPRIVIPMHYADGDQSSLFGSELAPLEKFLQQMGAKEVVAEEKVTVTTANLPGDDAETKLIIMKRTN
jgi:L-ascorbate metabolism protein UlaG (beta-lactamase superfamily)